MIRTRRRRSPTRRFARKGIAAVECALTAPLLVLLVLGAIDVGQFANVHQRVSDASREGARVAARYGTTSAAQVQQAVQRYFEQSSTGGNELASAATIAVTDSGANAITGSDITAVPSGAPVTVTVTVNYDSVRWLGRVPGLNGSQITATTIMRRE